MSTTDTTIAPADPQLPGLPASDLAPALPGRVCVADVTAGWQLPSYVVETFGDLTPAEWWAHCPDGQAMACILPAGEFGSPTRRRLAGVAAAFARLALPAFEAARPGDRRARKAIETAEAYACGEDVSRERLQDAGDAAYAAYAASRRKKVSRRRLLDASQAAADAHAAWSAAYAALAAAHAALAAALSDAAWSAAYAADAHAADAHAAAAYAERKRVLAECADIIRRHYPDVAWVLAEKQKEVR